jgi:acyl carrier protein
LPARPPPRYLFAHASEAECWLRCYALAAGVAYARLAPACQRRLQRGRRVSERLARLRAIIAEGVRQNPVAPVSDPELLARLADPGADCSFEELGYDSLARMELCIWLEVEHGIEINEATLFDYPSVMALAAHLARS